MFSPTTSDGKRLGDRRNQEVFVRDRRQRDKEDAASELFEQLGANLERKSSLAGAAGPGQRHQARSVVAKEFSDRCHLRSTPDQRIRLHRKVRRSVAKRLQGRKLEGEPFNHELIEAFGLEQVLQAVLAKVDDRPLVVERGLGRMGEDDLAAVPRRHHACRAMYIKADVAAVDESRLAAVYAHPNSQLMLLTPRVLCKRTLRVRRCGDGVVRGTKDDEERITLSVDLVPIVRIERSAQDPPVVCK